MKLHAEVSGDSSVGALVGYVGDLTIISNCQVTASVTGNTSSSTGTKIGGLVGRLTGGGVEISDCTFTGSVGGGNTTGGFIGSFYNTVVTNCFAGGAVTNIRHRYDGGFVGEASGGAIAGCARNAAASAYGAVGANNTVGAAHAGVADLTSAETLSPDSFPTFDFTSVWGIDSERGPYLMALAVPKSGYAVWAAANGLGEPSEVTDGVAHVFRYVFGCPSGKLPQPILAISFADGAPVVITPTPVNLDGVTVKVLASESLADWSSAVETELTVDSEGRIAFPAFASAPQMFFALQAVQR